MAETTKPGILVTGAGGLVGGRLISLAASDFDVWAMSRRPPDVSSSGTRWIRHDFETPSLPEGMPSGIDVVVHLAQAENHRDFPAAAPRIHAVAGDATLRLLDWAVRSGVRRFVLASSGGLYAPSTAPLTEESPLLIPDGPLGFYLTAKRVAELLALGYASALTVVVLRYFFIYGPGQRPSMLFPRLAASIDEGRPLLLRGADGMRFRPTHVEDAALAALAAARLDEGATINVAGPETVSLRRVGELIGEGLGREPRFEVDGSGENWDVDIARMSALLGPPRISPADGIPRTARELRRTTNSTDRD